MTRKRKPLDDVLASEFVYGESKTQDELLETKQQKSTEIEPIPKKSRSRSASASPRSLNKQVKSASSTKEKKNKELSLMDKLQTVEAKEATKRLTVDLAESLHRKLSIFSAKTGKSKADIVRLLLEDALEDVEQ